MNIAFSQQDFLVNNRGVLWTSMPRRIGSGRDFNIRFHFDWTMLWLHHWTLCRALWLTTPHLFAIQQRNEGEKGSGDSADSFDLAMKRDKQNALNRQDSQETLRNGAFSSRSSKIIKCLFEFLKIKFFPIKDTFRLLRTLRNRFIIAINFRKYISIIIRLTTTWNGLICGKRLKICGLMRFFFFKCLAEPMSDERFVVQGNSFSCSQSFIIYFSFVTATAVVDIVAVRRSFYRLDLRYVAIIPLDGVNGIHSMGDDVSFSIGLGVRGDRGWKAIANSRWISLLELTSDFRFIN